MATKRKGRTPIKDKAPEKLTLAEADTRYKDDMEFVRWCVNRILIRYSEMPRTPDFKEGFREVFMDMVAGVEDVYDEWKAWG